MAMTDLKTELDSPYQLSTADIDFFRENGFIKLKRVFSKELLDRYGSVITDRVIELNEMHLAMEDRDTYEKAFLQVMNLWTKDDVVRDFVFGRKLAKIASDLLGTDGVRLYHDQALYKEPSGGITPWHADQYYWPLDSDKTITAWVPLQPVPLDMGPLAFAAKSNHFPIGRDLPISDESEEVLQEALKNANFDRAVEAFELGEVSFHTGWTFHNAGPNTTDRPRRVMTVIYMDEAMRLTEPINENQEDDRRQWCPGAEVGEVIDTPLNPVLYSKETEIQTAA